MNLNPQSAGELATQQGGAMTLFSDDVPEWAKGGTNRGSENVSSKDMMLPRLEIVQGLSPIKDVNPDAKEGMLFNTVTGEVLGDTVYIVPIFFRVEWLVWKDQDEGGGFFGAWTTLEEAEARMQEVVSEGENPKYIEIIDTPVHYALMVDPQTGGHSQIVISMPKTKAKVSRKWNSVIQIVGGDRFARAYKFTTFKDRNRKNKEFYNYVVQPAGFPPEPVYREAERLYNIFKTEGVPRANHEAGGRADAGEEAPGHHGDNI